VKRDSVDYLTAPDAPRGNGAPIVASLIAM
jgi:hypothetical protein